MCISKERKHIWTCCLVQHFGQHNKILDCLSSHFAQKVDICGWIEKTAHFWLINWSLRRWSAQSNTMKGSKTVKSHNLYFPLIICCMKWDCSQRLATEEKSASLECVGSHEWALFRWKPFVVERITGATCSFGHGNNDYHPTVHLFQCFKKSKGRHEID